MVMTAPGAFDLAEHVHMLSDPESGLEGVIAIHSTALGPAAGGCRLWTYSSASAMVTDALRLAEGMSYKNAMAGLPLGGGKAVLRLPSAGFDRRRLFEAFGRAVAGLGGRYVTAEDVGTSVADMEYVRRTTRHVAGLTRREGVGGDPSPWTALGVFLAMDRAVERRLRRPLSDVTVAVQGIGHVGFALCELLYEAGARLVVADADRDRASRAAALFSATAVDPADVLAADVDVVAPCALGGMLDLLAIARLKATVVCGAANNQLATAADGRRLAERGVLYAPDYVVNAGGIISVAAEYLGWTGSEVEARIQAIPDRLSQVLDRAETTGEPANLAADGWARQLITAGAMRFAA